MEEQKEGIAVEYAGFWIRLVAYIIDWMIIDLRAWRAHMIRNKDKIEFDEIKNEDGSAFTWFNVNSFPNNPPILISCLDTDI